MQRSKGFDDCVGLDSEIAELVFQFQTTKYAKRTKNEHPPRLPSLNSPTPRTIKTLRLKPGGSPSWMPKETFLTELALHCKVSGVIVKNTYENKMVQAFGLVLPPRVSPGRSRVPVRDRILHHRFYSG